MLVTIIPDQTQKTMKNLIIIALFILMLDSCTTDSTTTNIGDQYFTAYNNTETSLNGTWYLQQQVISIPKSVTNYSGYGAAYNITFAYGLLGPKHPGISCKNYIGSWAPGIHCPPDQTNPGIFGGPPPDPNKVERSDFWCYDNGSATLYIGGVPSTMKLTGGLLIVTNINKDDTVVSTLHQ